MGQEVVRILLRTKIHKYRCYSLICNEKTDISNKNLATICLRTVDNNLKVSEGFMGFYHVANMKSDSIVVVIKDALTWFALKLDNFRVQTYDVASNVLGPRYGLAFRFWGRIL
jgi:hypothetical protein